MLGDRKKGVYDVTIQEANLKDAGKYECQTTFIKNGETVPIRSKFAPIDVLGKTNIFFYELFFLSKIMLVGMADKFVFEISIISNH